MPIKKHIQPGGVRILGHAAPYADTDVHATHLAWWGCGGFRSVNTLAERDAILPSRRDEGMWVLVLETNKVYQLGADMTTWTEVQFGTPNAVTGPGSATNNDVAVFDGTTGKAIKDGGKALPSGAIVGTTDSQTLTNKTLGAGTSFGSLVVPIANGGTGATNAAAARTSLGATTLGAALFTAPNNALGAVAFLRINSDSTVTLLSANDFRTAIGAGQGTVTSVGLSITGPIYTVSSPAVTGSGTLTATLASQSANRILAGPASGVAAAPTFRALVAGDIPDLDASKITSGQLPASRILTGDDGNSVCAGDDERVLNGDAAWRNGQLELPNATSLVDKMGYAVALNTDGTCRLPSSSSDYIAAVVISGGTTLSLVRLMCSAISTPVFLVSGQVRKGDPLTVIMTGGDAGKWRKCGAGEPIMAIAAADSPGNLRCPAILHGASTTPPAVNPSYTVSWGRYGPWGTVIYPTDTHVTTTETGFRYQASRTTAAGTYTVDAAPAYPNARYDDRWIFFAVPMEISGTIIQNQTYAAAWRPASFTASQTEIPLYNDADVYKYSLNGLSHEQRTIGGTKWRIYRFYNPTSASITFSVTVN